MAGTQSKSINSESLEMDLLFQIKSELITKCIPNFGRNYHLLRPKRAKRPGKILGKSISSDSFENAAYVVVEMTNETSVEMAAYKVCQLERSLAVSILANVCADQVSRSNSYYWSHCQVCILGFTLGPY